MKTKSKWRRLALLTLAGGFILPGCGPPLEHELKGLGLKYHYFYDENGRGPANADELRQHKSAFGETGELSKAWKAIDNGEFTLIWNAALSPDSDENEKYVLGYEKQVPAQGGLVMFGGCSVRYVSAEEFKKLPKIPQAE